MFAFSFYVTPFLFYVPIFWRTFNLSKSLMLQDLEEGMDEFKRFKRGFCSMAFATEFFILIRAIVYLIAVYLGKFEDANQTSKVMIFVSEALLTQHFLFMEWENHKEDKRSNKLTENLDTDKSIEPSLKQI